MTPKSKETFDMTPDSSLLEDIGKGAYTTPEALAELAANSFDAEIQGLPMTIQIEVKPEEIKEPIIKKLIDEEKAQFSNTNVKTKPEIERIIKQNAQHKENFEIKKMNQNVDASVSTSRLVSEKNDKDFIRSNLTSEKKIRINSKGYQHQELVKF